MKNIKIPIEISARHIHLCQKDLDKLFGAGYELTKLRDLSQKGEFAAEEILTAKIQTAFRQDRPKGRLNLRIVGPVRKESQIELALTDAVNLGLEAPLRLSGELKNVKAFLEVVGPQGKAKIKVIVAQRHLHCPPLEAKRLKLKNGEKVSVQIGGERGLVFENVVVRVSENGRLAAHLDTDEANAAGIGKVSKSGILKR